eukprot:TRINITY_DN1536_c0_g1_i1.p1 TRINITY_DN1536_c0_g1~~TRINITY_DN1536_c0_g1_i1.p1  ORF type:complete len:354 (+),score=8.98 TRINITY_DN1536_c0_g1_i1:434-1495(+)
MRDALMLSAIKPNKKGHNMAYIGQRFKTGQTCNASGKYQFDGYLDGTSSPSPTYEESVIPLDNNDVFPPIRSCNKGAWWKYIGNQQEFDQTINRDRRYSAVSLNNQREVLMESHWADIGIFWATALVGLITLIATGVNYLIYRTQRDGEIVVYAKTDTKRSTIISLVIENIGNGVAQNIEFSSSEPIPYGAFGWEPIPEDKREYMDTGAFAQGIPHLEPGGKREFDWGQYVALDSCLGDKLLEIEASYTSKGVLLPLKRRKKSLSFIDVKSFERTIAHDDNYMKKISEDIRRIKDSIDQVSRGNRTIRIKLETEQFFRESFENFEGISKGLDTSRYSLECGRFFYGQIQLASK